MVCRRLLYYVATPRPHDTLLRLPPPLALLSSFLPASLHRTAWFFQSQSTFVTTAFRPLSTASLEFADTSPAKYDIPSQFVELGQSDRIPGSRQGSSAFLSSGRMRPLSPDAQSYLVNSDPDQVTNQPRCASVIGFRFGFQWFRAPFIRASIISTRSSASNLRANTPQNANIRPETSLLLFLKLPFDPGREPAGARLVPPLHGDERAAHAHAAQLARDSIARNEPEGLVPPEP